MVPPGACGPQGSSDFSFNFMREEGAAAEATEVFISGAEVGI